MKKILLLETFYKGSHKYWVDSLKKYSCHQIETQTLNGAFWKWRFQQSSYEFRLAPDHSYDLILTSSLMNLAAWCGINRKNIGLTPLIHYFHENQFTYPNQDQEVAKTFGFYNILNAICADSVVFNSPFHKDIFFKSMREISPQLKDPLPLVDMENIEKKSSVLPIGLEVEEFLSHKIETVNARPLILWNHRWEADKNPDLFFKTLIDLKNDGIEFDLCVVGSSPKNWLPIFKQAQNELADRIVQWGKVQSRVEYIQWLWRADILPVTSRHDFFGISVLEAALCNCDLLLPQKNAYPDHFDPNLFKNAYYHSDEEFKWKLSQKLQQPKVSLNFSEKAQEFDWSKVILKYNQFFNNL